MKIGYARVSTLEQNLDLQLDALKKEGCQKIFTDQVSGAKKERPALQQLLDQLREGDVIIVWKLDRMGRSLKHLIDLVEDLNEKKVGLKSLNDPIDTTSAQGKFVFNIFASLAEFEKDLIKERTKAGLHSARIRGRNGGRPKGLSEEAQKTAMAAETLYKENQLSVNDICIKLNVSKSTLYRYLRHRNVKISPYVTNTK